MAFARKWSRLRHHYPYRRALHVDRPGDGCVCSGTQSVGQIIQHESSTHQEHSMEFLQEVHHPGLAIPRLKQSLTIENLPNLCASVSTAASPTETEGDLYCPWGLFRVRRDEIRNG